MAYDMCEFEECFFTQPFSPLSDSFTNDIPKTFQENNYTFNTLTHNILDTPFDESDQIAPTTTTLSSSPPCHQLQSLSKYQMGNSINSLYFCPLEIKTEESQLPFYECYTNINSFLPHSYGECDNFVNMMQKSLTESSNLQSMNLTSPDHSLSSSHMRRVNITCDLHRLEISRTLSTSPLSTKGSLMEETNFKVGRYSPEERKKKILRYKAKRTQRSFNKTIKYACRKTLADNRPRIRGRFARNDEPEEAPKTLTLQQYEVEDELWMEGFQEEYHGRITREHFFNTYVTTTPFHQFSYFHN